MPEPCTSKRRRSDKSSVTAASHGGQAVGVDTGTEAARRAWARLTGLPTLEPLRVFIDPESPLCPRGWIGILALDGTVTVSVPRRDLEAFLVDAMKGLTSEEATSPDAVLPRLPPMRATLGPVSLFYPCAGFLVGDESGVEKVSRHEVRALAESVASDEVDESGILKITSPAFGSRSEAGVLAALCGYRRWSNDVAHLSVLTHPEHRRRGHGRRAATAAIRHATEAGLFPQWRARPPVSQALARSLGLTELGTQLSVQPF